MEYDNEEIDKLIEAIHFKFMKSTSEKEKNLLRKLLHKHLNYKIKNLMEILENGSF